MSTYLTKKDLAEAAGLSYRRMFDIDAAMPEGAKLFVKGEGGKYDLAVFVQRWVKYNVDNVTGGAQTLEEIKALHEVVKTRKTELEVARLEGKLVDVFEIRKLWGDVANNVMQNMLKLPSKVAPYLVMLKDVEVITSIIAEEVREVLTQISETPLPAEAASEERAEDEEESEEE
jgi:uncharacterized protein YfaT (DUF1175 family)